MLQEGVARMSNKYPMSVMCHSILLQRNIYTYFIEYFRSIPFDIFPIYLQLVTHTTTEYIFMK